LGGLQACDLKRQSPELCRVSFNQILKCGVPPCEECELLRGRHLNPEIGDAHTISFRRVKDSADTLHVIEQRFLLLGLGRIL
jgi:hypothetical protein